MKKQELISWCEKKFTFQGLRKIGIETEYPVVWDRDFSQFPIQRVFPNFLKFGFEPIFDDIFQEELIGLKRGERVISTDAGIGLLEINEPPYESLWDAEKNCFSFFQWVRDLFYSHRALVLNYGVQPVSKEGGWVNKGRYDILKRILPVKVNNITLGAASQVHIDLHLSEVTKAVNTMNVLTGLLIALFANAPVYMGKDSGLMAIRETFWDEFVPERSGIPSRFSSYEEYIEKMLELPLLLKRQNGKYIKYGLPFENFLNDLDEDFSGFHIHEGTVWWDSRLRSLGTIEIRPVCCQSDCLSFPALCLGLIENLDEVADFTNRYSLKKWREVKKYAIRNGMKNSKEMLRDLISLAETGLKKRKIGEEVFLSTLWERIEKGKSPAEEKIEIFRNYGMKDLIRSSFLI